MEPAIKEAEGAADEADLAALLCGLARVRFSQDRVEEGLDLVDRGLPIAERNELHELLIEGLITKGNLLAKHGRPVEGNALAEGARRVAVERGFPEWEARALIAHEPADRPSATRAPPSSSSARRSTWCGGSGDGIWSCS